MQKRRQALFLSLFSLRDSLPLGPSPARSRIALDFRSLVLRARYQKERGTAHSLLQSYNVDKTFLSASSFTCRFSDVVHANKQFFVMLMKTTSSPLITLLDKGSLHKPSGTQLPELIPVSVA